MCLQGKDKVGYSPHLEKGDVVIVTNAEHVVFTGKKWKQKLYRHHTGWAMHAAYCTLLALMSLSYWSGLCSTACKNVSQKAFDNMQYTYNHCRYPGGLKERSAEQQYDKDPTQIVHKAVYGMLPKNKLRDVRSQLTIDHCIMTSSRKHASQHYLCKST